MPHSRPHVTLIATLVLLTLPAARGGAEVGLRTVAVPGLQTTVALWRLSLDSELVFVGDAGTTAPSRTSERYGVEASAFEAAPVARGRRRPLDACTVHGS